MEPVENRDALRQGVEAAKSGDKARARGLLREAIQEDPGNEMAWLWLASVGENYLETALSLEKALAINPSNKNAQIWLSKVRARLEDDLRTDGEPREAASAAAEPVPEKPAAQPARLEAPRSVTPRSSAEKSTWRCPLCDQAFAVKPLSCPRCQSVLALSDVSAFFESRDVREDLVQEAVQRLTAADPVANPVRRHRDLGLAHLNLKRFQKALSHLSAASALAPQDSELSLVVDELTKHLEKSQNARVSTPGPTPAAETREIPRRFDELGTAEIRVEFNPSGEPQAAEVEEAPPAEERRVLVVDDSPTVRQLLSVTLERQGFRVILASDGMEALAKLQEGIPELVLLDVTMPHLDGYKICRVVKQNELTQNVPVIFLSGNDGFLDKVRGRMAGAVEYITKPIDPASLVRVISKYCPQ